MTPTELYELVLIRSQLSALHPLHESMMRSCCESALMAGPDFTDTETLVFAVQLSFVKMNEILKNTLQSAFENRDEFVLNYRGLSFTIPAGSPLAG